MLKLKVLISLLCKSWLFYKACKPSSMQSDPEHALETGMPWKPSADPFRQSGCIVVQHGRRIAQVQVVGRVLDINGCEHSNLRKGTAVPNAEKDDGSAAPGEVFRNAAAPEEALHALALGLPIATGALI